ncbi:MAG: PAS domain S-box protein, partial [Proteobacteria bacterium]
IIYYNSRHYQYFGSTSEDHENWGWRDSAKPTIHPDDLERTTRIWGEALKSGEVYEIEYRLRRHDGTHRWHLGRASPSRDASGRILCWYGTNTDIHDQKVAEEALSEAVRARDEFLSIASHELKTPLTSLRLNAQVFNRAINNQDPLAFSRERVIDLVKKTDKQVTRLDRLVDDMLDVSRISSGQLKIERESFDICDLIEEVMDRMDQQFSVARYEKPKLVRCEESHGHWDRMRIEQVVTNLLTNAIRYGKNKPIEVGAERMADHQVRIWVKDNGMGISEATQEKIFGRFERSVDANEVSGLGLGLFISRQIVNAHGGKIYVKSKLGEGSTFVVELPI